MSAREIIATAISPDGRHPTYAERFFADSALTALSLKGFRILGPDEVDAVTVERCADVADAEAMVRDRRIDECEAHDGIGRERQRVGAQQSRILATAIRALKGYD